MKKITIFLTLIIFFTLSGCTLKNSNNTTKISPANPEIPTKMMNTNNLFSCESDTDCIITDSRYLNGCIAARGGCNLTSVNKNILEKLENKIKNDPSICKLTEDKVMRMHCIPDYCLKPICVENKCSKTEIKSKKDCNNSWVSMSSCIEQLNEK